MKLSTYFTFAISLALALLIPFFFGKAMLAALIKLQLSPTAALSALAAMLLGSFINIPVMRLPRHQPAAASAPAEICPAGVEPDLKITRNGTTVAINLGGCVIPSALALYEFALIAHAGTGEIVAALSAIGWNIAVCYIFAKPAPGIGIFIPGLIPPLMAAGCAYLLAPDFAAPVAFIAGTMGPLIGADILHLREIEESTGMASIGGAGTFDGIVLSGLLAALLA